MFDRDDLRQQPADEADDPWDDPEYPDPDDDPDDDLVACPECGAEVYEDSPRCPVCGEYITTVASVWADRSTWWILLGLLGVAAAILTLTLAL